MDNYRPISCLPIWSKIYERIVYDQFYLYLSTSRILNKGQFGFRRGKSTSHALLDVINYISNHLNDGNIVAAVFLDLRKAFDIVSHKILLKKLEHFGVTGQELSWFRDYLTNRKIITSCNGTLSNNNHYLSRSVPQGSILGPLLFLLFINDLPDSTILKCSLFADDTTCLAGGPDISSVGNLVNNELFKISQWLKSNELALNTSKTKVMIFSNKVKVPDFAFQFNFSNNMHSDDSNLIFNIDRISNSSEVPAFKLLGVYLDEHLSFNYHCKKLCNKISSCQFAINRVKNILSSSALKKLYYALIHPHILYGLLIYSCTNNSNINMIFKKQKQCVRTISKVQYNAHTEPLFWNLKILPLNDLILQQKLMLMHSIFYGYSVTMFDFQLNAEADLHRFALRNANNFFEPRSNKKSLDKLPIFELPKIWNNFDNDIKEKSNKLEFKTLIKYTRLDLYENFQCDKLFCRSCMLTV